MTGKGKNMSMVEFCDCPPGGHIEGCPVARRIKIKYALIKKYGITGNYVPEWLEQMVDKKMEGVL